MMGGRIGKCRYCMGTGYLCSGAFQSDLPCGYCDVGRELEAKNTMASEWHVGDLKKRLIRIEHKLDLVIKNQNHEPD